MGFAQTFVTIVHIILCAFLVFIILLQPGKDAGMGAAFGGGAATSAFGGRGAVTFLSKLTAATATLFFITSLGLSFAGLRRSVAAGIMAPVAGADAGTPAAPPAHEVPQGVEKPSKGVEGNPENPPAGPNEPPGGTLPPAPETHTANPLKQVPAPKAEPAPKK